METIITKENLQEIEKNLVNREYYFIRVFKETKIIIGEYLNSHNGVIFTGVEDVRKLKDCYSIDPTPITRQITPTDKEIDKMAEDYKNKKGSIPSTDLENEIANE